MGKRKISEWLFTRFPINVQKISELWEKAFIKEPIPQHMKNWFFALGATPLILFIFQAITGILLTLYYIPSPDRAYESVRYITEEVKFGYWIRGMHRWGSNLMVIAVILHIVRVFFTKGYKAPRELNWIIGSFLLIITLAFCFTGYSLIYNQLSYWATTVGTNMIAEIPLVGKFLLLLIRGGTDVTENSLIRLYNLHIGLLPTLFVILILLHIILVRLHGVSKAYPDEPTYSFYPEHFYTALQIMLLLLITLSVLSIILPPGIGEPADPNNTPLHIKPEWYFFAVYSILKILPLKVGIYFMTLVLLVFILWPFIDEALSGKIKMKISLHYIFGMVVILIFLFFTVYETIKY
jgi:quinol-cytochrome oxidoreductase complex cytochrome b subunit